MVSRSEIDLLDIRAEFKKLYESSLYSAIKVRRPLKKTYNCAATSSVLTTVCRVDPD